VLRTDTFVEAKFFREENLAHAKLRQWKAEVCGSCRKSNGKFASVEAAVKGASVASQKMDIQLSCSCA
jgi:hypothetical protein